MTVADALDGMTLAATVVGDRAASTVTEGLTPQLAAALTQRLEQLAALDKSERHARVRRWIKELGAVPTDLEAPARALALLASEVPRSLGRRWVAAAPPVRRGFRPGRGLRATLRRLARPTNKDAADHERGALGQITVTPEQLSKLRKLAARLNPSDPERALGALLLGMKDGRDGGDEKSASWRNLGQQLAELWEGRWRA